MQAGNCHPRIQLKVGSARRSGTATDLRCQERPVSDNSASEASVLVKQQDGNGSCRSMFAVLLVFVVGRRLIVLRGSGSRRRKAFARLREVGYFSTKHGAQLC
jgi:hypothetical protein